jgi:hypothetical protein
MVRTLAILYNPGGEVVSRDRIPNEASLGLQLEALKLVLDLDLDPFGNVARAMFLAKFLALRPIQYGTVSNPCILRQQEITLYKLLKLLCPRNFALITNTNRQTRGYVAGTWRFELAWYRLQTVVRAGSAAVLDSEYDPERGSFSRGSFWLDVDLVQIYTDAENRKGEIAKSIAREVDSRPDRPLSHKNLQIWVKTEEQVKAARATASRHHVPKAEVAKVNIEVHPDGLEGWWEDQKAKKRNQ